ncbi:MAG: chemotaxis protein CheW [Candidatus Zixiibacteriota bacterium]
MQNKRSQVLQIDNQDFGRAGKYLTFRLAEEEYGLEILKVRTIIELMDITPVPKSPHYVKGVIDLRGELIPIVDLRARFGMSKVETSYETVIIVVEARSEGGNVDVGLLVDSVSEVLDISEEDIDDSPAMGESVKSEDIRGIAKTKNSIKILLNIDSVLAGFNYKAAV